MNVNKIVKETIAEIFKDEELLNEGMGIPNIIKNIVNTLRDYYIDDVNYVNNQLKLNINNLSDLYNELYFEDIDIEINIVEDNYGAEYKHKSTKFNGNRLTNVEIVINVDINNRNNLIDKFLTHELLHSYEDYLRYVNNPKYSFKNMTDGRVSYSDKIENTIKNNPNLSRIKEFIYSTRDLERRAYVAQFYSEIKNVEDIDTYIRTGDYKNIITYSYYLRINNRIEDIMRSLSDNDLIALKEFVEMIGLNFSKTSNLEVFRNRFIVYIKNSTKDMLFKLNKVAIEYWNDITNKKPNNGKIS